MGRTAGQDQTFPNRPQLQPDLDAISCCTASSCRAGPPRPQRASAGCASLLVAFTWAARVPRRLALHSRWRGYLRYLPARVACRWVPQFGTQIRARATRSASCGKPAAPRRGGVPRQRARVSVARSTASAASTGWSPDGTRVSRQRRACSTSRPTTGEARPRWMLARCGGAGPTASQERTARE